MLNKTKGQMYNFITHTWNPIKGKCPHECSYCYMDKIYKRFGKMPAPVHLDEKELRTSLGSDNFIFVGSSIDMFADGVNSEWVKQVLRRCSIFCNSYLFQTKNPDNFYKYGGFYGLFPSKSIFCITLETNRYVQEIMQSACEPEKRALHFIDFPDVPIQKRMVTIEPILDFDLGEFVGMIKNMNPFQVNIGADTGNNHLPEPPKGKVLELIAELEKFTKVYQKKNLGRLLHEN